MSDVMQNNRLRILVYGSNSPYVDGFFDLHDNIECLTTSSRVRDFENHLKYFKPHVFMVPLRGITIELLPRFTPLRDCLSRYRVPLCAYGTKDEVSLFESIAEFRPDYIINSPQTMAKIIDELQYHLAKVGIFAGVSAPAGQTFERRHHILVIDDDVLMLRAIRRILEEDYDVATATSGKQAFKFLTDNDTDLILLDYNMPVQMGDAIFKELREWRKTADTPIIFLTGINDASEIKRLLVLKPQGYLMKPVEPELLLEKIKGALGG